MAERAERMGLVEWSRFLALSSHVAAAAWERHLEHGRGSMDFCGARPAVAGGRRPGWEVSVTCAERQPGDPTEASPARIVVELRGRGHPPQRVIFVLSGEAGSTNCMEATMNLLDQWADLLRTHCLTP